jgi:hypothetical protein
MEDFADPIRTPGGANHPVLNTPAQTGAVKVKAFRELRPTPPHSHKAYLNENKLKTTNSLFPLRYNRIGAL